MHSAHVLILSAALCATATAQVPIGGNIYDGAGGPLLTGVVYHTTGHLTVPIGQTLTAQRGAIVKFSGSALFVDGTLTCNGTAQSPVIFTSIHDDAAGGDTNGNGNATTPAPDQWYGVKFSSTSGASNVARTTVRYGGQGYWPLLDIVTANVTITDSRFTDGSWGGIRLDAGARPTVTRCAFERIDGSPAAFGASIGAVPGFTDGTTANCSGGAYLRIDGTTLTANVTINRNNCMGGALVYANHVSVPTRTTLTLNEGVVLKPSSSYTITVDGTLLCNGTAANKVVLTSIHDDAAGGDTNGNGNATAPAPEQWNGVKFNGTADASVMTHTIVRYTGVSYWPAIDVASANIALTSCTISDGRWGGLHLDASARPTVTGCSFERILGSPAVFGASIGSVAGFTNNTVANCSGGNYLRIDVTNVTGNVSISANNAMGGALVYADHIRVPVGTSLALQRDVVLKPSAAYSVQVAGTLFCSGTASAPVIFTSFQDDAAGGDTNGDGAATAPGPEQWMGMTFADTADSSSLQHAIVRYGGASYWPLVDLVSADVTFRDCTFSDGRWGGMRLDASSMPTVTDCDFEWIEANPAVFRASIGAVPGFADNTVANCAGGNYLRVESTTVTGNVTIRANNCLGGALVYSDHLRVPVGMTLQLDNGVILKPSSGLLIDVLGQLDVHGHVVFTSFQDDVYGGDTNGDDLATIPAPNQWWGIQLANTATGTIDRALIRCTGVYSYPALGCASSGVTLRRSRVELAGGVGFDLGDAAAADDLVTYRGVGDGIRLSGGAFDLRRSTSGYNSGYGVVKSAGWTGTVRSSIAWGNQAGDFQAFAAGDILYSDGAGIVGGTGNRNVDPQFVSSGVGDLRLRSSSPCVDAGDPADQATGRDMLGYPRYLDGNLLGVQRVDMGAHEYDNVTLTVTGNARPGGTLTLATASTTRIRLGLLVLGVEKPSGTPLFNFGRLYVDLAGPFVSAAWPVNGSVPIAIPATISTPVALSLQVVGLADPFPRGNTSNLVTVAIE